jgi:hypothetical protein
VSDRNHRRAASVPTDPVQPLEARRLMSFTAIGRPDLLSGVTRSTDLAVAGDGSYYVAYVNAVRSPSLNRDVNVLSVQRYDARGLAAGDALLISRYVAPGTFVSIDASAGSQAVVTYVERRGAADALSFTRLSASGIGSSVRFFESPAGLLRDNGQPVLDGADVSMTDDGGFFLAHRVAGGESLRTSYVEPGFDTNLDDVLALEPASELYATLGNFGIAARPDGSGAVFVADTAGGGGDRILFATVGTTTKTSSNRTLGTVGADLAQPVIAADGSRYVIAYTRGGTSDAFGGQRVFAQVVGQGGILQGAAIAVSEGISTSNAFETLNPSISFVPSSFVTGANGFAVGFVRTDVNGNTAAYARRYDFNGTPDESGAVYVAPSVTAATEVGHDGSGNTVIAYRTPPARGVSAIATRRLTNGIILDGREVYAIGTGQNDRILIDGESSPEGRVRVTAGTLARSYPGRQVAAVSVLGLEGNDRIDHVSVVPATLSGGAGADVILGGPSSDLILGDSGSDFLYGNGGNDRIDGGGNSDRVRGGDGDDTLLGGAGGGKDLLFGDPGNDLLTGGAGTDRLFGGTGDDRGTRDDRDLFDGIETVVRR